ncbi:hypothetical protein H2198_008054, partial [Neophaeococcomyces mojaviensis]
MATSSKLARYEILLDQIFPLVSLEVRNLIDDARHQENGTSGPYDVLSRNASASFSAPDVDVASNSLSAQRAPLSLAPSPTHQHSSFVTASRILPAPVLSEIPDTPLRPIPTSEATTRSPIDDQGSVTVLRLPSITRHGFLVDEGLDTPSVPGFGSPLTDPLNPDERNATVVGMNRLHM